MLIGKETVKRLSPSGLPAASPSTTAVEGPVYSPTIEQSVRIHFGLKRNIDLVLATGLLILLAPVFMIVGLAIVLDSSGSPIYKQRRKGWHQKPFWIYKFRTMHKDAHALRSQMAERNEVDGIIFKIKSDPRVTRVGRWLRRFSLDELPQLLNVIKGDMSLVGPRPFSVEVFQRMDFSDANYRKWLLGRHRVLPGMTGLWQINGRNDVPFKELMRLDLEYVRNWSVFLDVLILVQTIRAIWNTKGAY